MQVGLEQSPFGWSTAFLTAVSSLVGIRGLLDGLFLVALSIHAASWSKLASRR